MTPHVVSPGWIIRPCDLFITIYWYKLLYLCRSMTSDLPEYDLWYSGVWPLIFRSMTSDLQEYNLWSSGLCPLMFRSMTFDLHEYDLWSSEVWLWSSRVWPLIFMSLTSDLQESDLWSSGVWPLIFRNMNSDLTITLHTIIHTTICVCWQCIFNAGVNLRPKHRWTMIYS